MLSVGHLEDTDKGNLKIIQISRPTFDIYPISLPKRALKRQNQDHSEHTITYCFYLLYDEHFPLVLNIIYNTINNSDRLFSKIKCIYMICK